MKITSLDKTIKSLLEGGYYRIPRFQRPYSWTKENVEEFWKDAINDDELDYFIGSMVVFTEGTSSFGLVDGQQRLTTITIALAALRNAMKKAGEQQLADGVHRLIERPDINSKLQFVLQTESSYPYLQEHIQKFGEPEAEAKGTEEEESIQSAFEFLTSAIDEKIQGCLLALGKKPTASAKKAAVASTLISIRDKILGLNVIFVELMDEDDAYVIFETLNTRGKDLQVSDLVKNHLSKLWKAKNKGVDLFKDKWIELQELIETSNAEIDTNIFLLHFWLSKFEYTTSKKLFKALRTTVDKASAKKFLEQLILEAKEYRTICEPEYRTWNKNDFDLRDALRAIGQFRVRQPLPLMLALMSEYREKAISKKHIRQSMKTLECFHLMSTAVTSQRSSGGVSKMYASAGKNLREAKGQQKKAKVLKDLRAKLKKKIPEYNEFEVNFQNIKFSEVYSKQKKLVQYLLEHFDRDIRGDVPIDYSKMTIEHIAPQNSPGKSGEPADVVAEIGNLILLPQGLNEKLENKSFPEKMKILKREKVPMDKFLSGASDWTKKEINARSKNMAARAYDVIWNF